MDSANHSLVASREEAIAWTKRCPAPDSEIVEVGQMQEIANPSPDVQTVAAGT